MTADQTLQRAFLPPWNYQSERNCVYSEHYLGSVFWVGESTPVHFVQMHELPGHSWAIGVIPWEGFRFTAHFQNQLQLVVMGHLFQFQRTQLRLQ